MSIVASLLSGGVLNLGSELIDNLFETEEEKAKAKARLVELEQQGRLQNMQTQLSAILAEANSDDPWTSRARPTFLYVIYSAISMCFVGAIVGVFYPDHVTTAAQNLTNLLAAIPESLWWLFGAGYLGYTGGRSFDKYQRARQTPTPGRKPVKGLPWRE